MMENVRVAEGERLEIRYIRISRAIKWERNPKKHDLEGIKESIRKHGFRDAPIWDNTLQGVVGGNGRIEAISEMQESDDVPPRGILLAADDGEWCVPIQFGIDSGSIAQAEAFAIDHNNLTLGGSELTAYERSTIWDDRYFEILQEVRGEGEEIVTIDDETFEAIRMARQIPLPIEIEEKPPGERLDKAEEILLEWQVEYGDIWQVGEHRLMCGDAVNAGHLEQLLDDELIEWMWTDPPYGVNYEGRTKDKLVMQSDKSDDLDVFLADAFQNLDTYMVGGCPIYLCHPSGRLSVVFGRIFQETGWLFHQTLVWVKDVMVMGHSDYHYQHEPIIYGWKKGAKRPWRGGRNRVSAFHVDRPSKSEHHPTIKPVELIVQHLENSTEKGALGIDPFCGSGSTMVAAEQSERKVYCMDIEPKYCAVTLERLKDLGVIGERVKSP